MFGMEQRNDFLVSHFLCASLVEDGEPLLPVFACLCGDSVVTHARTILGFVCSHGVFSIVLTYFEEAPSEQF